MSDRIIFLFLHTNTYMCAHDSHVRKSLRYLFSVLEKFSSQNVFNTQTVIPGAHSIIYLVHDKTDYFFTANITIISYTGR